MDLTKQLQHGKKVYVVGNLRLWILAHVMNSDSWEQAPENNGIKQPLYFANLVTLLGIRPGHNADVRKWKDSNIHTQDDLH